MDGKEGHARTTSLTGMKFKLAHRRADKGTWNASVQAQRRRLITILRQVSEELEREAAVNEATSGRPGPVERRQRRTATPAGPKRPANGTHSRAA